MQTVFMCLLRLRVHCCSVVIVSLFIISGKQIVAGLHEIILCLHKVFPRVTLGYIKDKHWIQLKVTQISVSFG